MPVHVLSPHMLLWLSSILKYIQVNNFFKAPILPGFSPLCTIHNEQIARNYSSYVISNTPQLTCALTWEKKYEAWNEDLKMRHGVDLEDNEKMLWLAVALGTWYVVMS